MNQSSHLQKKKILNMTLSSFNISNIIHVSKKGCINEKIIVDTNISDLTNSEYQC